jgi:hypothetical protein
MTNDNFIGTRERAKYNSQKMLFEYGLNKYFQVTGPTYIYIQNNFAEADHVFIMGLSGPTSSRLVLNSQNAESYMGLVASYSTDVYDYTIYVPLAVFNALGTSDANREAAIRSFADIYNLAGMSYNVISY